ncbi:MAG: antibiotic biosynthesis monooxygenase [Krumholzibacteria bacterium]|nr:antibiotic biosynthesis monooxygenase [Candidatus Krumholzibacteria bacterium]
MGGDGVVVIISYVCQPGKADQAVREISELIATVQRVEPDCGGIELLQQTDDPSRIMLVEQWTSREAYLGPHFQQPHILAFIERAGQFLVEPPVITFWRAGGAA